MSSTKADLRQLFGDHVRKIRLEKGLTLRAVATRCDIDNSHISKIENGRLDIQISKLFQLAKGLGVQPKELLDFEINLEE